MNPSKCALKNRKSFPLFYTQGVTRSPLCGFPPPSNFRGQEEQLEQVEHASVPTKKTIKQEPRNLTNTDGTVLANRCSRGYCSGYGIFKRRAVGGTFLRTSAIHITGWNFNDPDNSCRTIQRQEHCDWCMGCLQPSASASRNFAS